MANQIPAIIRSIYERVRVLWRTLKQNAGGGSHQGIKIVMDLVVNHTSDEQTHGSWRVKNPKITRIVIIISGVREKTAKSRITGVLYLNGPAWEYDGRYRYVLFTYVLQKQPDLNWENPKVRDEVFSTYELVV